ncbi:SAVED domain-containing protein [Miltoncostaea oceani]|uniref:SAVED domain-containing protein n=1 Tax=Miltoncostaea oceani TaxID=2843216 RepID=UPI001C3E3A81|nr:SAVED domain-containing protein [Miltoncostaea oceani]
MSLRPFLCHAREDRLRLEEFSAQLSLMGADGWQDVNDLRLGSPSEGEIRRVIAEDAGGFIWFGTPASMTSRFIRKVEIPAALGRGRRGGFPVVPLFSDLRPGDLPRRPRLCLPRWRGSLAALGGLNGVLRADGEDDPTLWRRAAGDYVRHALVARGSAPITISFSCTAVPDHTAEVAVDWRAVVEETTSGIDGARVTHAAGNLESALREAGVRRVRITGDLYAPLAAALGYQWRAVSGLQLEVAQRFGGREMTVSSKMLASGFSVVPARQARGGEGPVLVVVSAPEPIDGAAGRYADEIGAEEIITLHAPHVLSEDQIGGLAQQAARLLADLSDLGRDKHLVVRGPMSLAIMIGAASNAIGPTRVPLWDRSGGYLPGLVIGGAAMVASGQLPAPSKP